MNSQAGGRSVTANKNPAITTVTRLAAIVVLAGSLIGIPLASSAATPPAAGPAYDAVSVSAYGTPSDCPWDGQRL
jgi:hypothetical protein